MQNIIILVFTKNPNNNYKLRIEGYREMHYNLRL